MISVAEKAKIKARADIDRRKRFRHANQSTPNKFERVERSASPEWGTLPTPKRGKKSLNTRSSTRTAVNRSSTDDNRYDSSFGSLSTSTQRLASNFDCQTLVTSVGALKRSRLFTPAPETHLQVSNTDCASRSHREAVPTGHHAWGLPPPVRCRKDDQPIAHPIRHHQVRSAPNTDYQYANPSPYLNYTHQNIHQLAADKRCTDPDYPQAGADFQTVKNGDAAAIADRRRREEEWKSSAQRQPERQASTQADTVEMASLDFRYGPVHARY